MMNDVFYGSAEGGWIYPLINGNVVLPVKMGVLLSATGAFLIYHSRRCIDQFPTLVIAMWLLVATAGQATIRTLAPFPDRDAVSMGSNGFYRDAGAYPPTKFLRDFREIAPHLHFHVRANLAGKVLFYHLLRGITDSPADIAWLILGVSNLGALLAYAIVRELFNDRFAGLAALILYLFLPSKIFFFPLLNTVSPVFILLPLWLLVRYLATRKPTWLVAMGVSLYALVLFEPLPLITGLTFVALIGRAWGLHTIDWKNVVALIAVVPLGFFVTNLVVAQAFGYEIVSAFEFAYHDAKEFNVRQNRPYDVWLVANPIETLSNTGLFTSAIVFGIAGVGMFQMSRVMWAKGWRSAWAVACEPELCLAMSALASLAVVDSMGINRGETVRLWIFLGVFLQLPVARLCARRPVLLIGVLTGSIMQACVGLGSRGFVLPG